MMSSYKDMPCKIFQGRLTLKGYGHQCRRGRTYLAHRLAWIDVHGPIPEGLQLDHLCRVRACIEVTHLEPVTPAENSRRGETGAHLRRKTHCPKGHPYSGENLYVDSSKRRHCKECRRAAQVKFNRKKAAHAVSNRSTESDSRR